MQVIVSCLFDHEAMVHSEELQVIQANYASKT